MHLLALCISRIICPNWDLFNLEWLTAEITLKESPSTSAQKILISWEKVSACLAAKASTMSTDQGRWIFWLRAASIFPSESLITTPRPTHPKLANTAPSKLILNKHEGGGCHFVTAHVVADRYWWELTSQNSCSRSRALLTVSPTSHTCWPSLILLRLTQMHHTTMENKVAMFGEVLDSTKETRSLNLWKCLGLGKLKVGLENHIHLTWSHIHRQWMKSLGWSSHRLQVLSSSTCLNHRLEQVGRDSPEAHHMKFLTLFGTCSFQIPLRSCFKPSGLEVPGSASWEAVASNL